MNKTNRFLAIFLFALAIYPDKINSQEILPEIKPNDYTIEMSRRLTKDVFELNGVPYLQPTVEVMNTTSNARFYNTAFVPSKVDKPYFRVGLHGMWGVVPDNKKTYVPKLPQQKLTTEELLKYGTANYDPINNKFSYEITDTAGMVYAALKGILYDGLTQGSLKSPASAPTTLGTGNVQFLLPTDTLKKLLENLIIDVPILGKVKIFDYLPPDMQDTLRNLFKDFPVFVNLPEGSNLNYFYAVVPQVEIGSLFGTELLLRFIPPVDMGKDIGEFTFWGFGLKHSISQYFNDGDEPEQRYFDMAVQAVYQGTKLKNSIGVTNSDLQADATMWNVNLHASKHFDGIFDVYSGISFEMIDITSEYIYFLPLEMQWALGLIDKYQNEPENGFPPNTQPTKPGWNDRVYEHLGDTAPQKASVKLSDVNFKWNIGLSRDIGPVTIFMDFNYGKLLMLTGGLVYNF